MVAEMSNEGHEHATLTAASYGKDLVRIMRVVRGPDGKHEVAEYTLCALLEGDLSRAYTHGDNSPIVATDSIKNTLNLLAKTLAPQTVLCPELFAMHAATHFVKTYKHISSAQIELIQHRWTRITLQEGKEHPHSFVRDGDEKRTVDVRVEKNSPEEEPFLKYLRGGLKGLLLLKSTGSAFHGFIRDEYTTLPEVHDRIFSTEVECNYTFSLPSTSATSLLTSSSLPQFSHLSALVRSLTIHIFSTDDSASVQATMYRMASAILKADTDASIDSVEYSLPNKHYIPISLDWAGVDNTKEQDAEVFLPSAHPSGLIKAKISRNPEEKKTA